MHIRSIQAILMGVMSVAAAPALGQLNIALVGDSITRGNRDGETLLGNNYPTHLQGLFDAAYGEGGYHIGDSTNHDFFNGFGKGGATLRFDGNTPYVEDLAYTEALAYQPDVVVIMLGTNDARLGTAFNQSQGRWNWNNPTLDGEGNTSVDRFLEDYQSLISTFDGLASAPDIIVMSPISPSTVVFGGGASIDDATINNEIAPAVRDHVASFAEVDGFIDLNALFPHDDATYYDGDDRIHPSSLGYEFIAQQVFDLLTAPLTGDVNGDFLVGVEDLDVLQANWGQTVTAGDFSQGDLTGDGLVGEADFDIVVSHWGDRGLAYTGTSPVPEPTTGLVLLAGLGWVARRRRR